MLNNFTMTTPTSDNVKAPSLAELQTRPCSQEELQAALVQLIEVHNKLNARINELSSDGRIRSRNEVLMNTPYGL